MRRTWYTFGRHPFEVYFDGDQYWFSVRDVCDYLRLMFPEDFTKNINTKLMHGREWISQGSLLTRLNKQGDRLSEHLAEWIKECVMIQPKSTIPLPAPVVPPGCGVIDIDGVEVRTVARKGVNWFALEDLRRSLGFATDHEALILVGMEEKSGIISEVVAKSTIGARATRWARTTWWISESGLYKLLACSNAPAAQRFRERLDPNYEEPMTTALVPVTPEPQPQGEIVGFSFNNTELRVIDRGGEPWFFARDVCNQLGLVNTTRALAALDDDEKSNFQSLNVGPKKGGKPPVIISESGLYALIHRSSKPIAKEFRRWVNREVLPTIRKTGSYGAPALVDQERVAVLERYERLVPVLIKERTARENDILEERRQLQKWTKELAATRDTLEEWQHELRTMQVRLKDQQPKPRRVPWRHRYMRTRR